LSILPAVDLLEMALPLSANSSSVGETSRMLFPAAAQRSFGAANPCYYAMLQRNLLYTGITRSKRLVVLVGQKKAIAIAVRNVSGRRRSTTYL